MRFFLYVKNGNTEIYHIYRKGENDYGKIFKRNDKWGICDCRFKNSNFTVCFTFDPDSDVAVRIRFRSDDTMETKVNISTDAETNLITLTCINCENTMEFCSSDPIYLGKYHEKDLYLNFWVNSAGYDSMKKITYTLYKELCRKYLFSFL